MVTPTLREAKLFLCLTKYHVMEAYLVLS